MQNFTINKITLFFILSIFLNLPNSIGNSNDDVCFDDKNIYIQTDHSRHTVFLSSFEKTVTICNLNVGKNYKVYLSSFEQAPECVFELTHSSQKRLTSFISDNNFLEFTAKGECMEFVIRNANCITDTEYPVEVSISCNDCNSSVQSMMEMAGILTDPNYSVQSLIEDVFIGGGCFEISNVTPIGNTQGIGYFSNGGSSISIDEGVILASGAIANAHGPNTATNITTNFGDGSGDQDLNILSGGNVFDAVGIEFDFTPTLDMIEFNYVFASDEYCDYVNTQFNDVFGFFISGPGISGGFSLGAENIALVPGTNLDVSINNVNIQTNSGYYVDNVPLGQGQQGPFPCTQDLAQQGYAINDCEYDGFTTVLTAEANVQVCETYHIRLVVGDVGDGIFDSAVFLQANSFNAGEGASMDFDIPGLETNGIAYEGCTSGYIIFDRPPESNLNEDLVVEFTIDPNSTATSGLDYSTLPPSITIPAGETQFILPFEIFLDLLDEGIETLILNLSNPCTCDEASIELEISDMQPLEVYTPDFEFCEETTIQIPASPTGGVPNYTYLWDNGMTSPSLTVTAPVGTSSYSVTVTDECGNTEESTTTIVVEEQEFATIEGFVEVCPGNPTGTLTINFEGEGPWDLVLLLDGNPVDAFVGITDNPFTYDVTQIGTYTIGSLFVGPCPGEGAGAGVVIETLMLLFPVPEDVSCYGLFDGSINLTIAGGAPEYTYAWSNDTYEQNASDLAPGVYTVTVTDLNGCTEIAEAEIFAPEEILAEAVETQSVDCIDPYSGAADLTVSGGTPVFTFEWDNGSVQEDPSNLSAGPHTVTVTDANGCTKEATVEITQTSAPPIVVADVSGILTCEVLEVTIDGSNSSGNDITFEWFNENDSLLSIETQIDVNEIGEYTLIVTNTDNGCTADTTVFVVEDVEAPIADAGTANVLNCTETEITLDGSGSSLGDSISYSWQDDTNTEIGDEIFVGINAPGTYTLVVTNTDNGCTSLDEITIGQNIESPVPDAVVDNVLTCITSEATLDGSGSTGNGPLAFQWLDDLNNEISDTSTAVVVDPGMYTLIVTNTENGCTEQTEIEVLQDIESPNAAVDDPDILNCLVTSIQLDGNASNGSAPLTFQWLDSEDNEIGDSEVVDVNTPGVYTLIITNTENGCTDEITATVDQDIENPTPVAEVDGILTCVNQLVLLDGSSSTANGNLAFEWLDPNSNPIGNESTVEVDEPGTYTLFITNSENGCSSSTIVEIDQDIEAPIADAGQGGILSCDISTVELDGSNSTGNNMIFEWFNESGSVINDQPQVSVSETGEYTLVVTNTINGCSSSAIVEVVPDENLPTAIIAGGGILTCDITDVMLDGSASGSVSGLMSLEWFDPNNAPISDNPDIVVNEPGIYTLVVTDEDNGCTVSALVEVPQDLSPPIADAGENDTLSCSLTQLTLNGSGSNANLMTFEWFDSFENSISLTQDVEIENPGIYTLVVTNTENGCTGEDEVEIVPDMNLPIAIAGEGGTLTCTTEAIILDASASTQGNNFIYEWMYNGNSIWSDLVLEVNEPGTYTIIVTNTENGCTSEDEVDVLEDVQLPVSDIIGIGPLELNCDVASVILDGSNSVPFGNLDFEWSTPDGNILTDLEMPQVEINEAGTYILVVTNSLNGCTDSQTFEIMENQTPPSAIINPAPLLTCTVPEVQLNAINTSGSGTFAYQWVSNPTGGIVSGDTTLNPMIDQAGEYILTILNQDNGCESSVSVIVDEDIDLPDAFAAVNDELDCVTDEVQLDGTGSSVGANFNYQWSGGGIIQGVNTLQPTVNQSGIYTLIVTNIENGCTNSDDTFVDENTNVPSALDALVTPPPCVGDPGSIEILTVTGGEGPYLYSIDGGNNFYGDSFFAGLTPGAYSITIQDAVGCLYEDELYIEEAQPIYVVTELDLELELGDTVQLEAFVNVPLSEIDTIIWSPSEFLSCSNCLEPYAFPSSLTIFTITVVNINGCEATDKITLRVKKDRGIYIPNVFSPHNNDGINDEFMIFSDGKSVKNINAFQVFDRWGEKVFEDYNFMPDDPAHSWDGWLKDEPMNPAVFVYWAEIEFIDGVVILYKGDVTLIK